MIQLTRKYSNLSRSQFGLSGITVRIWVEAIFCKYWPAVSNTNTHEIGHDFFFFFFVVSLETNKKKAELFTSDIKTDHMLFSALTLLRC